MRLEERERFSYFYGKTQRKKLDSLYWLPLSDRITLNQTYAIFSFVFHALLHFNVFMVKKYSWCSQEMWFFFQIKVQKGDPSTSQIFSGTLFIYFFFSFSFYCFLGVLPMIRTGTNYNSQSPFASLWSPSECFLGVEYLHTTAVKNQLGSSTVHQPEHSEDLHWVWEGELKWAYLLCILVFRS